MSREIQSRDERDIELPVVSPGANRTPPAPDRPKPPEKSEVHKRVFRSAVIAGNLEGVRYVVGRFGVCVDDPREESVITSFRNFSKC